MVRAIPQILVCMSLKVIDSIPKIKPKLCFR